MKKRYFSIVYKETNEPIGIAVADTSEELTEKVILACESHFDSKVSIPNIPMKEHDEGTVWISKVWVWNPDTVGGGFNIFLEIDETPIY